MPIKDNEGKVLGVAQAINKISAKEEQFDEHDEKVRWKIYWCFATIIESNVQ